MKTFFSVVIYWLCICITASAQLPSQQITVFESGKDGYKSFRIPAIIKDNHMLFAFAEGRVNGTADFGDVDIVMKKSKDGGKSWSSLKVVASNGKMQAGNAAPVLDITDPRFPKGRLFLFYNTGDKNESEVRKGNGLRQVWYTTSVDMGETWSEPNNITAQVHHAKQLSAAVADHIPVSWRSYANTPGHAIQIQSGKYRGRMYIAANHSEGEPQKNFTDYFAHGYFTDDHGASFQLSENVPVPGGNEAMAVELTNSRLMMNIRNQKGNPRVRIIALSSNGGVTWDTAYYDHQLPDPVCQGSILNLGSKNGRAVLAFCNAADKMHRDSLMLRISFDEGKTWTENYLIDKAPEASKADNAAYSDIVKLGRKKIGILYEKANYSKIVFVTHQWK